MHPEEIGPYRVESRLGVGGMGEVYRAYDARLHRRVAIKLIRPERATRAGVRERFRREARAAAALSHRSIVQIFDILEHEDGDCIVMELVEGETLSTRLLRGTLPIPIALDLALEVADALDEAHRHGIVHRDLKSDNVMITASGQAKILDFGVAKQLVRTEGEESLTVEGGVLGTYHAMAPEQARGESVDHRADLFSLGVMLYQCLTGEAPFRAPTVAETLTKVCLHDPPPVHELAPDVPAPVSTLITQLLEKSPDRRPRSAHEVVLELERLGAGQRSRTGVSAWSASMSGATLVDDPGSRLPSTAAPQPTSALDPASPRSSRALFLAVGLVVVALLVVLWLRRPIRPEYVAVTRTQLGTAGTLAAPELIGQAVRDAVVRGVLQLEGLAPIALDQVDAVEGPSAEVARAVAADEVITSQLDCQEARCQLSLARVRSEDATVVWQRRFQLPLDDLLVASTVVIDTVRTAYASRRSRRDVSALVVAEADYEAFLSVRQRYFRRAPGTSLASLIAELSGVQSRSPSFVQAHLLRGRMERDRFLSSRDVVALDAAFAAAREARRLAPHDPQPLFALAAAALDGARLDELRKAIDSLEALEPGHSRVSALRALLLEREGRTAEALDMMNRAVEQHPSWRNLFDLANMAYRNGALDVTRARLGDLLELFPDHFAGRDLLAQVELLDNPAHAAELYEQLVEQAPGLATLANLGLAYFLLERYAEAADCFRRAKAIAPASPYPPLGLADTELLLGNRDVAMDEYQLVLRLIEQDPAADQWHFLTMRAQALAHLGDRHQAVAALQRAFRLSPENPQVAYEAALVYVLVGDLASALVNAEQAVARGYDRRWLDLPWFDPLRDRPAFQRLLEPPP